MRANDVHTEIALAMQWEGGVVRIEGQSSDVKAVTYAV